VLPTAPGRNLGTDGALGGDRGGSGCRNGGYAASGTPGIAGSDCIHDAGELRFWSVSWIYQDHFLQADLSGHFLAIRLTIKFIKHVPPESRRRRDLVAREVGYTYI